MRKVLRIARNILVLFVVVVALFAAWNWRMVYQIAEFSPILLPPMYGTPANEAEARAQDLRYFRKLITIDRSFSEDARHAFTALVGELEQRTGNMSDADLYLGVSKAAALADNGHTGVSTRPLYTRFNTIGAKLYWFADGLFVVRADAEHGETVGTRVIAIEGRPLDSVISELSPYRGGVAQWRRLFMPLMIESPEIMHAAGLASSPDAMTLSLETAGGDVRDVGFVGTHAENADKLPARRPWMTLKPEALPGEDASWTRALSMTGDAAPLYLRDSDGPLYAPLPGNGRYIRTQTGSGTPELSVPDFFKQALAGIADGSLDYLVADYRINSGGDYTQSIDFAKLAPAKINPGGRLYLAVGPQTFSAALVTVAMLKYYGGEKSMIVGTPMGDREQFWAETGMAFVLPNSKFRIDYATGYHDWNKGCEGHPYCFTQNLIHQVPAGSLAPVTVLAPTFADYASGRDVVMDWILSQRTRPD